MEITKTVWRLLRDCVEITKTEWRLLRDCVEITKTVWRLLRDCVEITKTVWRLLTSSCMAGGSAARNSGLTSIPPGLSELCCSRVLCCIRCRRK